MPGLACIAVPGPLIAPLAPRPQVRRLTILETLRAFIAHFNPPAQQQLRAAEVPGPQELRGL